MLTPSSPQRQQTTYLKMVALNAVLAFSGCFVAADFASFPVLDRIATRMGFSDSAASANASTFLVECRELSLVLHNVTTASLVLIDELVCRLRVGGVVCVLDVLRRALAAGPCVVHA